MTPKLDPWPGLLLQPLTYLSTCLLSINTRVSTGHLKFHTCKVEPGITPVRIASRLSLQTMTPPSNYSLRPETFLTPLIPLSLSSLSLLFCLHHQAEYDQPVPPGLLCTLLHTEPRPALGQQASVSSSFSWLSRQRAPGRNGGRQD